MRVLRGGGVARRNTGLTHHPPLRREAQVAHPSPHVPPAAPILDADGPVMGKMAREVCRGGEAVQGRLAHGQPGQRVRPEQRPAGPGIRSCQQR